MQIRALAPLLAGLVGSSVVFAQGLDPALIGRWRVVEIDGKPALHGEKFTFADGSINGKSACNYVHAHVKQAGSALEIVGKVTITVMSCGIDRTAAVRGRWGAERRYLDAFGAIRGYTVTDEALLLTGAGGRVLMRLTK
jgi:heat shock protein HslJ